MNLVVEGLRLGFDQPDGSRQIVLEIDELLAKSGDRIGVTGPSGAGKTSLIYTLSGIQMPDEGAVNWEQVELTTLKEARRDSWRREHVGIVFQGFHLFPGMTILQNVLIPASFGRRRDKGELRERSHHLLERVGAPHRSRSVETLSRGERQLYWNRPCAAHGAERHFCR